MEKTTTITDPVLAGAFLDHFESVQALLAERIDAFDLQDGAYSASLLAESMKKLEVQAMLSGLTVLQPFFSAFETLLKSVVLPDPETAQTAADLLARLFSAFTRLLGDYAQSLAETATDSDTPATLCTDIEPARLEAMFARIAELRGTWPDRMVEPFDEPSFHLAPEVVELLVFEGGELLRRLQTALHAAAENENTAAQPGRAIDSLSSIASILRAFAGNTELALRSSPAPAGALHPLVLIGALLGKMLALAESDEADRKLQSEQGRSVFGQAAASLGRLLGELEENLERTATDTHELEAALVALQEEPPAGPAAQVAPGSPEETGPPLTRPRIVERAAEAGAGPEGEETHIRVKQEKLDQLTNLVSELVVAKNSLSHVRSLLGGNVDAGAIQALENSEKLFSRVIHDMDKTVMGMRMQRVTELFQRFPRMIRDIAKKNGKLIQLSLQGGETLMDNLILKTISDPLVHLVRNACDHGIEPPEQREKNGKPATGRLQLSAGNEGGRIVVEVSDDGRGIDADRIKKLAVERGLISSAEAEAMDDKTAQKLIFAPGFSTAAEVTDISGRGVGMDVVRTNTEQVGGEIEIESLVGISTRVRLLLPLTLSISKGLKVVVCRQRFIIPLENVVTMLSTEPERIRRHADHLFLPLADRTISLMSLAGLLELGDAYGFMENEQLPVVLMDVKGKTAGVVVDAILGIEEIVTKPMPGDLSRLPYYSGCCIMSDGSVVAVLNPVALLQPRSGQAR